MTTDDFPAFCKAVHGYEPFPWQARLAQEVAANGWPPVLDLPTAAGKTSTLDVALFTLALQAGRAPVDRTVPLRIFFIIDRRLVVDQAADHARKLKLALEDEHAPPLIRQVADALLRFGGRLPLAVAALRGGMYRDDSWARAPNQPMICVSTVDQVGSRLLFRGYGLTEARRPVHAALVGNDALYLVDEAHLSQPFLETLHAVRSKYRGWAEDPQGGHLCVVELSATPQTEGTRFVLAEEDRRHKILQKRLQTTKPAVLEEPARFEMETAAKAQGALERDGVKIVGVVVNRVASARRIFERLREDFEGDAVLLTGRIRPWDREQLLHRWLPRMRAGRPRAPDDQSLFVVATQTVEVGADLDFDFLITEAAPLPALRQRFGRLDRLGHFGRAAGVIVRRHPEGPDPIYGDDLAAAWDWLKRSATHGDNGMSIDFGIDALDMLIRQGPEPPRPAARHAPVLLPAHLDSWVQTSPTPQPDPDVAPFLHGPEALDAADVQIVWRADLAWDDSKNREGLERDWIEALTVARPTVLETLPVPVSVARDWLLRIAAADIADVEGAAGGNEREAKKGTPRPALRWRGPDESQLIGPGEVRPGDTLVVPSSYGGADEFGWRGWQPGQQIPVNDVGDQCFNRMADAGPRDGPKRPIRLRLHPNLFAQFLTGEDREARLTDFATTLRRACGILEGDEEGDCQEALHGLLTAYRSAACAEQLLLKSIEHFLADERTKVIVYPGGLLLHGSVRPGFSGSQEPLPPEVSDLADVTAEDDTASVLSRRVSLKDHSAGVVNWVKRFTDGYSEGLAHVFERAAELHDLGKADGRFQTMLYGGDVIEAAAGELLAKSGMDREDAEAFRRAWRLSGLPPHFRHEFVSVALIRAHRGVLLPGVAEADRDLVEYLVGTHHGRGHPFVPVVHETEPEEVAMDWNGIQLNTSPNHGLWWLGSGWVDLFWRLVRRFGYWGLAHLEATLVLADQACSREEERVL